MRQHTRGPTQLDIDLAVSKTETYRAALHELDDWEPFLLGESKLPGPRANLELLHVVADEGRREQFQSWLAMDRKHAATNTPGEFLVACGAVGLGHLAAQGQHHLLEELRRHASDPRWRVREGVAMGLQRLGARDMPKLLKVMRDWSTGNWLERRAVVAALCEPALLGNEAAARAVVEILDQITASLAEAPDRHLEDFRTLRQALAYGWSVAVVATPDTGKLLLEEWLNSADPDIAWMARENLKKNRLKQMDAAWVAGLSRA